MTPLTNSQKVTLVIQLNCNLIGSLFYADDLVILSESVSGLQKSLKSLQNVEAEY